MRESNTGTIAIRSKQNYVEHLLCRCMEAGQILSGLSLHGGDKKMPSVEDASLLTLTTEEAMALLEICLMSEIEFDDIQQETLVKLSVYCRERYKKYRDSETRSACTEKTSPLRPVLRVA